MLMIYRFIIIFLLISLAACKSSPTGDVSTGSTVAVAGAKSSSDGDVGVVNSLEEPVISSADTNLPNSAIQGKYSVKLGDFNHYPKETSGWDATGWSVISPSTDSRLIYVSSSIGDDVTAEFYAPRDIIDVREPGLIKPYRTIHAALEQAREGFPDWILLQAGDNWVLSENLELKSGRSVKERFVFTSYGKTDQRPILKSSSAETLRIWPNTNFIAITNLSLYAHKRDPNSGDFAGWGSVGESLGIRVYSSEDTVMGSLLVENNKLNYFSKAITIGGGGEVFDVIIRRNIILNSYSELNHSQGMYASQASVFLEENLFDHNGWYQPQVDGSNSKVGGQANIFNHNTYFSGARHTKFLNNIFMRSSSIHNKWAATSDGGEDTIKSHDLWVEGNVYVGGEIGISAGGNTDYNTGPRWRNVHIVNNVMLAIGRDRPTNRSLGWYIDASDWSGGAICGNYLLHNDSPLVTNLIGVKLAGHSEHVAISDNTIHGLLRGDERTSAGAITIDGDPKAAILISGNNIQLHQSKLRTVVTAGLENLEFIGNKYFSAGDPELWFQSEGDDLNFEDWMLAANDTSSTVIRDSFMEPQRTFETYLTSIGLPESLDSFVEARAKQSKAGWSADLTANSFVSYIQDGYGNLMCLKTEAELLSDDI